MAETEKDAREGHERVREGGRESVNKRESDKEDVMNM